MKKYLFLAASALALASCSSDDIIGNNGGGQQSADNVAINFNSGTNNITRATKTGTDAATALNNNFVVYGYKTATGDPATSVVYDHYNVNWLGTESGTQSESNTAGWEYVGQTINSLNSVPGSQQTIKYWDFSAYQYDFVAFSFGEAEQGTAVTASKVDNTPKYTLTGSVDNLQKCFIADRVTAKKSVTSEEKTNYANKLVAYRDPVQFNFRSLKTLVKMAIYETIPGYSIKDVKYYVDNTETTPSGTAPTLFNTNKTIPAGEGTITVTFGENTTTATDFNQAKVTWTVAEGSANKSTISWADGLSTQGKEANEKNGTEFIGRNINTKSASDYQGVIPSKIGGLTLKVDYTLESTDGSGEEIKVTGATATIPEVYTNWLPNYAYTYIFKISDKTNGGTGTGEDPKGLYPITFDAVVTETETGKQETITTVEENSITTYAKGAVNEEYKTNQNIYVSVGNNQALQTNTSTDAGTVKNIALFTVDEANTTGYAITEANVALALSKTPAEGTYTLTEGSNKLTVKTATGLELANEIAAADAVDGNAISGNFAKFTPTAAGNYVVEYTATDGKKYYKVIKVVE